MAHLVERSSSMCYERYKRRHREEAESRRIWEEFERPTRISDPPPETVEPDVTEPEITEPERAEQPITSGR